MARRSGVSIDRRADQVVWRMSLHEACALRDHLDATLPLNDSARIHIDDLGNALQSLRPKPAIDQLADDIMADRLRDTGMY